MENDPNPYAVTARAPPEFHSVPDFVAGSISVNDNNMGALRVQEQKANGAHQKFMEAAATAGEHVNDGRAYRFKVAYKIAELKGQARDIARLRAQQAHLRASREALDKKIRLVMEPKLKFAKGRLALQQETLEKKMKQFDMLNMTHQKFKAETIKKLSAKKQVHKMLKVANKELLEAQKEQKDTALQYFGLKNAAAKQVQAYQYVVTKFKAAETETQETEKQTMKVKKALKRMRKIFKLEEQKLQVAYANGETRIANKIQRAEKKLLATQSTMKAEKTQFKEWQEDQYKRSKEKALKKQEYDASLKAYAEKRKKTLQAAWSNAGKRAEEHYGDGENDWAWNDWAGPDADEGINMDIANSDMKDCADAETADGALYTTPPPGGFANDVSGSAPSQQAPGFPQGMSPSTNRYAPNAGMVDPAGLVDQYRSPPPLALASADASNAQVADLQVAGTEPIY
jgi:hypothetical protein